MAISASYLFKGDSVKIFVIDDEKFYAEKIAGLINESCDSNVQIEVYSSVADTVDVDWLQYDIAFLDIEIGDNLGVDLALNIRQVNTQIIIVFVTSHTKYISDALKSMPFQYLVKPIDENLFKNEFKRATDNLLSMKSTISVPWNNQDSVVKISEIEYIESANRRREIVMIDKVIYNSLSTIKEFELQLSAYGLIKCHNSFLINVKHIKRLSSNIITMESGKNIYVSRKCIEATKRAFINTAVRG